MTEPSHIGKNLILQGTLTGDEDVVVEGQINGSISITKHLVVETSGSIEADLQVEDLTVAGTVRGDVQASRRILIKKTGTLVGNMKAPKIMIEEGALFNGRIETHAQPENDGAPPPFPLRENPIELPVLAKQKAEEVTNDIRITPKPPTLAGKKSIVKKK
jgi:cytoskeletal protein CcmA (bactofilin family)